MKAGSASSSANRAAGTSDSSRTGSRPTASQRTGSTHRNMRRARSSQDHRRLVAMVCSRASESGSWVRTVNDRYAFTSEEVSRQEYDRREWGGRASIEAERRGGAPVWRQEYDRREWGGRAGV